MNRKFRWVCAVLCTSLLIIGFLAVFYIAWTDGYWATIECLIGLLLGFIFAPIFHELGHVIVGSTQKMQCSYFKAFCIRLQKVEGKMQFSFASPFTADQTQMLPKCGGNMQRRASFYSLGGLIFGGAFLLVVLLLAVLFSILGVTTYILWGILPYAAYLFILNIFPVEYAAGKTDMLIYLGIKHGYDAEKNMLSAMEIQGQLFEGKTFTQIDNSYYFDLPQLAEDEPMFAVMLDLKYRYYLEKEDLDSAADCLNRLSQAQAYLSEEETEKIAAEFVYMHSLLHDKDGAEESAKYCKEYLKKNTVTAKRILAAWSKENELSVATDVLIKQANAALEKEWILGVKKFESILISRIQSV